MKLKMKDKYNLTLEENIFLAKRLIVDNIYSMRKERKGLPP